MDPNYITPNGLEKIRRELTWLEKEERPRIVAEVAYAASLGDRSENAEYHYGKKRLRKIDGRRRFLVKQLERVRVVDPAALKGSKVLFGATVVLETEEGEEQTWRIYGEDEVDTDAGIISWKSPIGKALLGKSEGDAVRFRAPRGMRELEIIAVRFDPQAPLSDDLSFNF